MLKTLAAFGFLALATGNIAFAEPPAGKGKPDKGDGGGGGSPASIEFGFDWVDRDGTDLFGLSAANGTNYQTVIAGSQVSTFTVEDISLVSNEALINDYGRLFLVSWDYNASGNVGSAVSRLVVDNVGSSISCAAFSKDGTRIAYSKYGSTLWSVPTSDPSAQPSLEYTLEGEDLFGACDYDLDGSIVAEAVTPVAGSGDTLHRLSRFVLGAGAQEEVIVGPETNAWFPSVDVGAYGSLAYSRVVNGSPNVTFESSGGSSTIQNASAAVYDCEEGRLAYQSRHKRSGKRNWLILHLPTGLTSDFPERAQTRGLEWVC